MKTEIRIMIAMQYLTLAIMYYALDALAASLVMAAGTLCWFFLAIKSSIYD